MARTPDQIAALFYDHFKDSRKDPHSRKFDTGATVFLQAGRLTTKQVRWLEGVYRRTNQDSGSSECTGSIQDLVGYWTLAIYPNGAGLLKVFSW